MRSPVLNVMANAALKAARGLMRDFGEVEQLQVSVKGPGEFVSTADLKAERTLKSELGRAGPATACCSRKAARSGGRPRGTAGSSTRSTARPISCTASRISRSRSRLERDGEIVAGVVYEPTRDEMYWPKRALGAFCQRPAAAGFGAAPTRRGGHRHRNAVSAHAATSRPISPRSRRSWPATSGVRRMGAAALDLAYVAAGRFDGFWEFGLAPGTSPPGCCWCARRAAMSAICRRPRHDGDRRRARRQRPSASPAGRAAAPIAPVQGGALSGRLTHGKVEQLKRSSRQLLMYSASPVR